MNLIILAAELLREAEKLIDQKIHPQTIIAGWRSATNVAREALKNAAADNSADPDRFREDLLNIARTTLSSKILSQHKEHFSKLAVDAVLRLKGSGNLSAIQIIKKRGGTLADSFLDEGFLLDKKPGVHQPQRVTDARILIANTPMDTDKIKVKKNYMSLLVLIISSNSPIVIDILVYRYLDLESELIQWQKLQN